MAETHSNFKRAQKKLMLAVNSRHWVLLSIALLFAGAFIKLSYNVLFDVEDRNWIQHWDNQILLSLAGHRSGILNAVMVDITALGSVTIVVLIGVVFFGAFVMLRDYLGIIQLALVSAGAGAWTWVFKQFAERPRPTLIPQLVEVSGYSFPSGHSLGAAALYLTFAIMAAKHFESWLHAIALQVLAAVVIACIALSRVYLGVHFPSDVLSGALFGAAWAYFVAASLTWLSSRNS